MSVRSGGKSIPAVTEQTVGKKSRQLFIIFVWLTLILVIAVFYDVAIKTLVEDPRVVIPTLALIPIAILAGVLIYKWKMPTLPATLIALVLLAASIFHYQVYSVRQVKEFLKEKGIPVRL